MSILNLKRLSNSVLRTNYKFIKDQRKKILKKLDSNLVTDQKKKLEKDYIALGRNLSKIEIEFSYRSSELLKSIVADWQK